eukprot:5626162-Pyramimonas_sp.AAC.1
MSRPAGTARGVRWGQLGLHGGAGCAPPSALPIQRREPNIEQPVCSDCFGVLAASSGSQGCQKAAQEEWKTGPSDGVEGYGTQVSKPRRKISWGRIASNPGLPNWA